MGVVTSVSIMLIGISFSYAHNRVSVARMETATFDYRPAAIWEGVRMGSGKAIIEVGIYLPVLTPIMRVVASMALFALEKRDALYAFITAVVLALTLVGLL